ncbi:MAG: hypothetical protein WCZ28_00610 [Burkholderiaceae bacterium]
MNQAAPAPARQLGRLALPSLVAALNHVLDQHPAARERLRMFGERRLRLGVEPGAGWGLVPDLWLAIDADGRLAASEPGEAGVQMLLRPSPQAGFDWLRDGVRGLSSHMRIEGDVMLAATLGELLQSVRWDGEEDLSRVVGDIAARRIAGGSRAARGLVADAGERLYRQLGGFIESGESPLARSAELDRQRERCAAMAQRVDVLARRIRDRNELPGR